MIHVARWSATSPPIAALPVSPDALAADEVVWIDLENPTPEEEDQILRKFLPVHPLTLDDMTKPRRDPEHGAHHPKVEEFADYLFVVVNPLPASLNGNGDESTEMHLHQLNHPQLSAVLTSNILVTHHYEPLNCITELRNYCQRHTERTSRGPDYLFHLILDSLVDEYTPVVEQIADSLDELETDLFTRPNPKLLARLLHLKRRVTFLRKTLILEREVLARLTRGEFHLVDQREIAYYRNVYDHLVRYTDLIEAAREMVSDLMQTHLSAVSTRLNEVMKVLTMISTIVLPMTLIAGVYGMNFEKLPETKWEYGYPFALGLMALTAIASLGYFRWKRWV